MTDIEWFNVDEVQDNMTFDLFGGWQRNNKPMCQGWMDESFQLNNSGHIGKKGS